MQVTVGTTATRLDDPTVGAIETIVLKDASAEIRLGGPTVAWADGWPYDESDPILTLRTNEQGIWAIVNASTATVHVLSI